VILQRPGAKMHAKLAVADRRVLLITSANLTRSGVTKNIEAGLLIRGGTALSERRSTSRRYAPAAISPG
jgi:phosphatidylserine/phosphatidylglycerophosphate/cardiolipin synthase-like enzyme